MPSLHERGARRRTLDGSVADVDREITSGEKRPEAARARYKKEVIVLTPPLLAKSCVTRPIRGRDNCLFRIVLPL
jgi:hypothetical protein